MAQDATLETLLLLNGEKFFLDNSGHYRAEIVAQRVPVSAAKPHGIDYSLVLIGPDGERLVGYDNAHSIRVRKGPSGRGPAEQDHRHRGARVVSYAYTDAASLLEDFWSDVDDVLRKKGVYP